MQPIPILKLGEVLIISIQIDLSDKMALNLQDDILHRLEKTNANGILIDISALEVVDSFMGRVLSEIALAAKLMNAETVIVGMRPAVAITLVELGLELQGLHTALNMEKGLQLLSTVV
jgi:rsbT antagonist protein RsbS